MYKLVVDLGGAKKQMVAGIKQTYSKEDLIGKTVVVVTNLKPAKIAGLDSEVMLLAAKNPEGKYVALTTDSVVEPGTKVE